METPPPTNIISIEGNIGSGKSTLVEKLRAKYASHPRICFLQEPVDVWNTIRDKQGNTMLSKFYGNTKKYSFAFQMMAYISRLSLLRKAIQENYDTIVIERSMYTDKMVFAKMLYDGGSMEEVEFRIYNKWFEEFIGDLPPIHIIYVRTSPETAMNRVTKRAREGEAITLEYLRDCHKYHEDWLNAEERFYDKKIVIQGDTNIENEPSMMDVWLERCGIFMEGMGKE